VSARKAFVTGGTGFVGANLVRALLEAGWRVKALARAGSDRRNLDGLDVELVQGDLFDPNLPTALRGSDALFHVAAHYSLWQRDRAAVMRDNVEGTRAILRAARDGLVPRTVYTSSVAAIGTDHGRICNEAYQSAPEDLVGSYKLSKYLAEQEAKLAAAAGQDVVIVNPTTPIGPWDRKPTPTGEIFVRFLSGRMPAYVDTGLNFVDVSDVVRGHLLAFERGRSGERYILGGENLTLRELLARIGAFAGVPPPKLALPLWIPLGVAWVDENILGRLGFEPSVPIDGVRMSKHAMYYDWSKAKSELGYAPGPIDGSIRAAIEWFAANGYLPKRR
jgi:dihydroflavonol-4-reductase